MMVVDLLFNEMISSDFLVQRRAQMSEYLFLRQYQLYIHASV